jgi:hypothetical protein
MATLVYHRPLGMRNTVALVASAALMVLMATGSAAQTAPYTEGSVGI